MSDVGQLQNQISPINSALTGFHSLSDIRHPTSDLRHPTSRLQRQCTEHAPRGDWEIVDYNA